MRIVGCVALRVTAERRGGGGLGSRARRVATPRERRGRRVKLVEAAAR
jgi:hypothetical protein